MKKMEKFKIKIPGILEAQSQNPSWKTVIMFTIAIVAIIIMQLTS